MNRSAHRANRAQRRAAKHRRGWLIAAAGAAGAAALVTAGALGGFEPAEIPVHRLGAGETFTGEHLEVTLDEAFLVDAIEEQFLEPDPGFRLLVANLTVTNLTDAAIGSTNRTPGVSSTLFGGDRSIIFLEGAAESYAEVWYPSGAGSSPDFQPGLPTAFVAAWTVPDDFAAEGDEVELDIRGFEIASGAVVISEHVQQFLITGTDAVLTTTVSDRGAAL